MNRWERGVSVGDDEPCIFCGEPATDDGERLMAWDGEGWVARSAHVECRYRNVMGGIEHLTADPDHEPGSCYEGSTLTYRESGRAAMQWRASHRE